MSASTRAVAAVGLALVVTACQSAESPPLAESGSSFIPAAGLVPTSLLEAGARAARTSETNPYEGDDRATGDGERLYTWFNCSGCHGALGGGGIGPPLRDGRWIYGGEPDQIYLSIVQGRPQGMPVYGGRIPPDDVWKITAFVQSFGEGRDAPTDEPPQLGGSTGAVP